MTTTVMYSISGKYATNNPRLVLWRHLCSVDTEAEVAPAIAKAKARHPGATFKVTKVTIIEEPVEVDRA